MQVSTGDKKKSFRDLMYPNHFLFNNYQKGLVTGNNTSKPTTMLQPQQQMFTYPPRIPSPLLPAGEMDGFVLPKEVNPNLAFDKAIESGYTKKYGSIPKPEMQSDRIYLPSINDNKKAVPYFSKEDVLTTDKYSSFSPELAGLIVPSSTPINFYGLLPKGLEQLKENSPVNLAENTANLTNPAQTVDSLINGIDPLSAISSVGGLVGDAIGGTAGKVAEGIGSLAAGIGGIITGNPLTAISAVTNIAGMFGESAEEKVAREQKERFDKAITDLNNAKYSSKDIRDLKSGTERAGATQMATTANRYASAGAGVLNKGAFMGQALAPIMAQLTQQQANIEATTMGYNKEIEKTKAILPTQMQNITTPTFMDKLQAGVEGTVGTYLGEKQMKMAEQMQTKQGEYMDAVMKDLEEDDVIDNTQNIVKGETKYSDLPNFTLGNSSIPNTYVPDFSKAIEIAGLLGNINSRKKNKNLSNFMEPTMNYNYFTPPSLISRLEYF